MQTLTYLIAEMRDLGIKSLALELQDESRLPPHQATNEERPTLAPGDTEQPEAEPKDPTLCVTQDCGAKAEGIFGGIGKQYCRTHAFQLAGVKT